MSLSNRVRIGILERDGYRCIYCGRTSADAALQVDHVLPRSLGGSDHSANLVTACFECNNGKRDVPLRLPPHFRPGPIRVELRPRHPLAPRRRRVRDIEVRPGEWRALAERIWGRDNDRGWIRGDDRYATVAWCGLLTVQLHASRESADAFGWRIDGCGRCCWGDHELVDLLRPDRMQPAIEEARRARRVEHLRSCPDCRAVSPGASTGAQERGVMRRGRAERHERGQVVGSLACETSPETHVDLILRDRKDGRRRRRSAAAA